MRVSVAKWQGTVEWVNRVQSHNCYYKYTSLETKHVRVRRPYLPLQWLANVKK